MIDMAFANALGVSAPYPGLRPFHRTESIIFFGRDQQVDQMLLKLQKCRFLAITGVSGCGKSSLVRAGLLPALDSGFMLNGGARWWVADMQPRNQPFKQLAQALLHSEALGEAWSEKDPRSLAMLSASLLTGPRSLLELWRQSQSESGGSLLLLVDQFEEVFRFGQHQDSNQAIAFVNLLLESARQSERRIYVVITMRSDFIGDCALFPELPEALNQGQFFTPRLNRSQCQAAIEGPAALFGCHFEDGLVNRILNEIGDDPDQLPLMQHALKRLWTGSQLSNINGVVDKPSGELSLIRYKEIGGIAQALSQHAEEVFKRLEGKTEQEGDKRVAQWLFRSLTERSLAKRDSRRPTTLQTIAEIARVDFVDVIRVVDAFRHPDCCFVTPPADIKLTRETVLDISHESLIRQWTRMKGWVESEARSAATFRRLADTARRWRDKQADLLRGRELEAIRLWQKSEMPARSWATRYDDDFDLAFEFLGKSIEASEDIDAEDDAQDLRVPVEYDVFLCYNSSDKSAVEEIARRLEAAGFRVFSDGNILPGGAWRLEINVAIERSANAAIFFGPNELGPRQQAELTIFLFRSSIGQRDDFRVIPVLLPSADPESLPVLLKGRVWVDFREGINDTEALRRLIAGVEGRAIEGSHEELPDTPVPYRGLTSFDAQDSCFFFGREAEVSTLIRDLLHNHFVAVVGAPGSGKSSLVNAGLWTETATRRLQKENYSPLFDWHILRARTGAGPFEWLSAAPALSSQFGRIDSIEFLDALRHSTDGIGDAIKNVFSGDKRPVLIIVDQFEELFSLGQNSAETAKFIDNLLDIIRSKDQRLYLLVTLRTDFLDRCFAYRGLLEVLQNHILLLGNLSRESLRAAILLPARRVGALFEEGLSEKILQDFANQPESLPLLQQSLKELWDRRKGPWLTIAAYNEIGGVLGCLEHRAETTYQSLSSEEQAITRFIFGRLINVSEQGSVSRRRVAYAEIRPVDEAPEDVNRVISKLSDAMLIVCSNEAVEIAHDALVYGWARLLNWLNEDREFLLWRQRLGTLVTEWERARESDQALLRGPLLIEAQKWADQRGQDLSDQEREFIHASREERDKLAEEGKERQERELEAIRRLAHAQQQRAEEAEKAQRLEEARAAEAEKRAQEQRVFTVRLRRSAKLVGGVAVIALILAGASTWFWLRARDAAELALIQKNLAQVERFAAETQEQIATVLRLAYASSALRGKNLQLSLLLGVEAVKVAKAANVRVPAAEQSLLSALGFDASRLFAQGESKLDSLALSLDGHWLATGSADGIPRVWDLTANDSRTNPVLLLGHEGAVTTIGFSPDNRWLVTGSLDQTARLWDWSAKDPATSPIVLRGQEGGVTAMAISPDGYWLITGSSDGTARLWDLTARDPAANPVVLRGHENAVTAIAISPDGRWVVTCSLDNTARLWDVRNRYSVANPVVLRGHGGAVTAAAISPDVHWLITGSRDGTARVWDLGARNPGANPVVLRGHEGEITAVAISPDARWLVTGSLDKTARLWDLTAKDPATRPIVLRGQEGGISAMAISPDNHWLVTGSEDHTARLWDLATNDPAISSIVLDSEAGAITAVAISADNHWLVTGSSEGTARLWTLRVSEWIDLVRSKANRNLTTDEWNFYFPGMPYRKTFSELPGPDQ